MQNYTKKILSKIFLNSPKKKAGKRIRRRKSKKSIDWQMAPDIKERLNEMSSKLELSHLEESRIFVYRSHNSSSSAYARTWGFPRIWQMSLNQKPAYVIEVLSERFDKLSKKDQDHVLLHELAHIPKNFSGSLLPHTRRRGKRNFHDRVEEMYAQYLEKL